MEGKSHLWYPKIYEKRAQWDLWKLLRTVTILCLNQRTWAFGSWTSWRSQDCKWSPFSKYQHEIRCSVFWTSCLKAAWLCHFKLYFGTSWCFSSFWVQLECKTQLCFVKSLAFLLGSKDSLTKETTRNTKTSNFNLFKEDYLT